MLDSVYNQPIKDGTDGAFTVNFKCYQTINYIVTFQIEEPNYISQDIDKTFICSSNQIVIPAIQVKFLLAKITIDIKGSVVDPYNKPVAALKLNFHSDPTSIQSSITTNTLGLYDISNTEVFPFTPYKFFVDFIDL